FLGLLLVEFEAVLEARAAAALDVHAQLEAGVSLLRDQFAHLARGRGGEIEPAFEGLVTGGGGKRIHVLRMGGAGAEFNRRRRNAPRPPTGRCVRPPRPAPAPGARSRARARTPRAASGRLRRAGNT